MIGDTLHDLEVAEAMGVDCVLVAAGHHPDHRLRRATDRVLDDLDQLRTVPGLSMAD
jgi:phosphoglycolate phosphatase